MIFSGVLAHLAMTHASAMTPDAGTKAARAESQAVADQSAAASANAAPDKPTRSGARSRVRATWTPKADRRHCLDRKSNDAIIRCAEGKE